MGAYRITYDLRHNGRRRKEKITIVKRCYSGGAEGGSQIKGLVATEAE